MVNLNTLAKSCQEIAAKRGKITSDLAHWPSAGSISEELMEFIRASEEKPSEHLPQYTEAQEELADILIVCLTELDRRGVDIEEIIIDKIAFNKTRIP